MFFAIITLAITAQTPQIPDPVVAPDAASQPSKDVATTKIETIELGSDKLVKGVIIKETGDAVFVDLGFDVLRIPLASIVRRVASGEASGEAVHDEGMYFRAERSERSIAEGARDVGPAVVKIESASGQGSGFIVNKRGHVVTNFHVVNGETEVDVKLFLRKDGSLEQRTLRKVKVVAINPSMDLALLKIEALEGLVLPHVFIGDSEAVAVGTRVYAIGTPIGLERTVSSGIISVNNRAFDGRTRLQITTPINPGNSGGPLFNLRGEVIGVNSSGYTSLQGLNFAIPSQYVMDFLRNRDAFAVDTTRSENGIHYLPAPTKPRSDPNSKGQ